MGIIAKRKINYGGHENVLFRYFAAGSKLSFWIYSCFCAEGTLPSGYPQPKPGHGESTSVGLFQQVLGLLEWATLAETLPLTLLNFFFFEIYCHPRFFSLPFISSINIRSVSWFKGSPHLLFLPPTLNLLHT